jgi:hypothetical protein
LGNLLGHAEREEKAMSGSEELEPLAEEGQIYEELEPLTAEDESREDVERDCLAGWPAASALFLGQDFRAHCASSTFDDLCEDDAILKVTSTLGANRVRVYEGEQLNAGSLAYDRTAWKERRQQVPIGGYRYFGSSIGPFVGSPLYFGCGVGTSAPHLR